MIFEMWFNKDENSYTLVDTATSSDKQYSFLTDGATKITEFEADSQEDAVAKRNAYLGWN